MTLDELSAREAIKDLKGRYCYHIDLKQWDEYAALFTEDATMDVDQSVSTRGRAANPMPQVNGSAAIRLAMPALLENADTVHQVHSPIIELTSPTTAKAIWAMEDIVKMPGFHLEARGHYHETYVLAGGKWRIASLHLSRTWINILEGTESGPDIEFASRIVK